MLGAGARLAAVAPALGEVVGEEVVCGAWDAGAVVVCVDVGAEAVLLGDWVGVAEAEGDWVTEGELDCVGACEVGADEGGANETAFACVA